MSRTKIIETLLLAVLMSGCVKDELDAGDTESVDTSGAISFGATADWTRGVEVEEITSLGLYSIFSYSKWTGAPKSDISSYFNSDYTSSIELTSKDQGATLEYGGGTRYWPTVDGQYLNFYALYPESELNVTFDSESGKPVFNYTMMGLANENDDIIFDALFDMTSATNNGVVDFNMEHILTKLTLQAAISNADKRDMVAFSYTDNNTGITVHADDHFLVNGITFSGLYNNAELVVDFVSGETTWTHDVDNTIEVSAAQGNTLLPLFTYDTYGKVNSINSAAILSDEHQSVMNIDAITNASKAIFMLPQLLDQQRSAAPTAKVRIRRMYYTEDDIVKDENNNAIVYHKYQTSTDEGITVKDVIDGEGILSSNPEDLYGEVSYYFKYNKIEPSGKVIYESASIVIPTASGKDGWEQGDHNILQFTFDLSKLSEYATPLTLTSTIYDWTETTVDVDMPQNTYIYASTDYFEIGAGETYADMIICTNYKYDLRRHHRNYELDGTPTDAAGFTYYLVDNTATNLDSWKDVSRLEPVLLWNNSGFTLSANHVYAELTEYEFTYDADGTLYLTPTDGGASEEVTLGADGYADPTLFVDKDGWMYFAIKPDPNDSSYDFYYKVKRSTRKEMNMYTNTSVGTDTSYGINMSEEDAVYTLRLIINNQHLDQTAGDGYGYFFGKIGAEAISNGGGLVTTKFRVTLRKKM